MACHKIKRYRIKDQPKITFSFCAVFKREKENINLHVVSLNFKPLQTASNSLLAG
jgi:hypothetical protein